MTIIETVFIECHGDPQAGIFPTTATINNFSFDPSVVAEAEQDEELDRVRRDIENLFESIWGEPVIVRFDYELPEAPSWD